MKKILTLTTAAVLFIGFAFANDGDKGKEKGKKAKAHKSCPGKECGKSKG